MNLRHVATLWTAGLALALAGCASNVRLEEDAPVETRNPGQSAEEAAAAAAAAARARALAEGSRITPVQAGGAGAGQGLGANGSRTVYFDFDSFTLRDDARPVVDAQSRRLNAERQRGLLLEGHTDERGGREYNLALGQKRADAVMRAMLVLGVAPTQLEAVSLGEERPADTGSGEAAWARNRRVELKDR